MTDEPKFQFPKNLFGPVLLIGIGALLLLSNFELITVNLLLILRMWPLILVGLGLNLMFGRDNPALGSILSIGMVIIALVIVFFAQDFGIRPTGGDLTTESFSEPLDDTKTAEIEIDIDRGSLDIAALKEDAILFEAEVTHNQKLTYKTSGTANKSIHLDLDQIDPFSFDWFDTPQIATIIKLSPEIPLSLNIDHGSGSATLDLAGLTLTDLNADTGSGRLIVTLPTGSYETDLSAGSGTLDITTLPNIALDLKANIGSGRMIITIGKETSGVIEVDAGSGIITIHIPEEIGVYIQGGTTSGSVTVPNGYTHSGDNAYGPSASGTWESPNYGDAEYQITINFGISSGNLTIREK